MTKRALLWWLGIVAFAFTYLAAVNVNQVRAAVMAIPGNPWSFSSPASAYCNGLWNPFGWFSRLCSDSLPQRLGVLAIGVVVLLMCGYFAEKGQPIRTAAAAVSRTSTTPPPRAVHSVAIDPSHSGVFYCTTQGCDFRSLTKTGAVAHGRLVPQPSSPPVALATATAPAEAETSADARPEFKTCPDCAEEVKFAARKCRFCGFMFEA